jgi:hypothetical protein
MKIPCLLLLLILISAARAEDPKPHATTKIAALAPAQKIRQPYIASDREHELTALTPPNFQFGKATLSIEKPTPAEIPSCHLTLNGVAFQALKANNPLELINPGAPEQYGSTDQDLLSDPISKEARGLKILELRF